MWNSLDEEIAYQCSTHTNAIGMPPTALRGGPLSGAGHEVRGGWSVVALHTQAQRYPWSSSSPSLYEEEAKQDGRWSSDSR